jgi:DNA-binding beta-propeller fold protein YncE
MNTRVSWLLGVALVAGLVAGCQSNEAPSTDASGPTYQFVEAWGGAGTEPSQFLEPIGIEVVGEEIVVSEAGNRRLQVLDREGTALRQVGPALPSGDSLRRPMHIAAAGSTLYVPDYNTDRVHVLSLEGSPQRTVDGSGLDGAGIPAAFDAPGGVAVDANGRLYVADFYNHRVVRLREGGAFDRQWGVTDSTGGADDRLSYPTDVAVHPDGGFVVADAYNHRIKRYAADGSLAWIRPEDRNWEGSDEGQFNVATAVATGPEGRIYVADFYNHRIQIFSAEGEFLTAFGEQGDGEGQFERPVDVAVGDDGTLYVVDFGNDRIQVFSPEL